MGNVSATTPASKRGSDPGTDRIAGLVLGCFWQPFVYLLAMLVSFGALESDLDRFVPSMVWLGLAPGCVVLSGFLICFLSPGRTLWFCIGAALCVGLLGSCLGLLDLGSGRPGTSGSSVMMMLRTLGFTASVSIVPAVAGYALRRLWELAKSVGF